MNKLRESELTELTGLASYLIRDKLLDITTLRMSLSAAKEQAMSLSQYLVHEKILSSDLIFTCCQHYFKIPCFDLKNYNLKWLQDSPVNFEMVLRYRILPLHKTQHEQNVGIVDPTDQRALSALAFATGLKINPFLIDEAELEKILSKEAEQETIYSKLDLVISKLTPIREDVTIDNDSPPDEPIINLVDVLINDALMKNISDIHIEPYEHYCRIRFRRDGLLYQASSLPLPVATQVIARLKILANLNITERRLAQDGRFQFCKKSKTDIRINTCPTLFGEKIVLRLLKSQALNLDIDSLGLPETQKNIFLEKLIQPQGLILVTGPTGSGKTTTLYSALHYLNHVTKNIISIEDPIEIELAGINQVNINSKIGLEFATMLRALLRQDPDIIMIGEIRDMETAEIAVEASQTGHLVLSTLHTNSAIESIIRLQSMIKKSNFIHAISLIIAQRLLRKLCPYCKRHTSQGYENDDKGCQFCHQGYQGRLGIFEFLPLTSSLTELILSRAGVKDLEMEAKKIGYLSLWEAGQKKVNTGLTTLNELKRVITHQL